MQVILESPGTNVLENTVQSDVQAAIQLQGVRLKAVQVYSDGDTITLTGKLNSFYLKQIAQETSNKVPGVYRVVNHIEVTKDTVNQLQF